MSGDRTKFVICFLLIIVFVAIFGYQLEAWTGFPKGADAYARITRIVYILDFFPNVFWQYHWANGMPTFKSEAPLFYFLGAALAKVFSLPAEKPLFIIGFLTFVLIGLGIFGYVKTLTKSFVAGLLAATLALSSFSLWSWIVSGGIYPRIFGVGLSLLALWRVVSFLKAVKDSPVFPRGKFVWLVLTLSLTMMAHALMAFFSWMAIFFILLFSPLSLKSKIKYAFLIYLVAFCLSSFFLLPAIFNFGFGASRFIGVISPVLPTAIYYLYEFAGIGPFILPLLVISFFLVILLASKWQSLMPPFLMLILFSTYALIGYTGLLGRYYYINGFIPLSSTLFITLYASIIIGLLFGYLGEVSRRLVPAVILLLTVLVALSSIFIGIPAIKNDGRQININDTASSGPKNDVYRLQQILKFPQEQDFDHRFAAYDAAEAVWFNVFYRIPQVRDYYGQGILYPDWRYWFEQAVWNPEEFSLKEARSAFDWFAVRWFTTYESDVSIRIYEASEGEPEEARRRYGGLPIPEFLNQSQNRYLHEPGFEFISYGRIHYDGIQEQFEIENPSPILAASNSPTLLFIGDPKDYNLLFSSLTFGNYSTQKIIPIKSKKKYLDDYSLTDLKPYDGLLLYRYQYRNPQKAAELLSDYLEQGGNLAWENYDSPQIAALAPFSSLEIKETKGGAWDLKVVKHQLTEEIKFSTFSPPLYNEAPWKVITGETDSLKSWGEILLSSKEGPLLVVGSHGKGKIVWSGFNFLYHLNAYKNLEEAEFWYRILDWLVEIEPQEDISFQTSFINPQKREIKIEDKTKGVVFKESYYPQWQAFLYDNNNQKKKLAIDLAGPGMMYVPLDQEGAYPVKVVLQYRLSVIEKFGIFLSLGTFLLLLGYGLKFELVERAISGLMKKPAFLFKRTGSWWDDEEY